MKVVEAIKDMQKLLFIKSYLSNRSPRDYCLFLLGINTGIRINDLLHLHVKDVMSIHGDIFHFLQSTAYNNPPVYLNSSVRQALIACINDCELKHHDFLFKSKKTSEPITRQQAYRIINEAARKAGITEAIGTHTLRKTFGYHAYQQGIAVSFIQKRLQQGTPSETRHYIGAGEVNIDPIKIDVNL